ncbi:MAG TPA: UDP-N-acetylmuramoyl-L-alanine--D-glutamate ligase, partial [Bacillota bacterium]|nr:UDP-N-acetylmuramoyl-L-alanine--D-glutamate ligase [Bacillota bacterium]
MTGDEILAAAAQKGASVLGFGISNVPLTDFLLKHGINVCVYDSKKREEQTTDIDSYEKRGVRFIFGEDYLKKLVDANISHGGTVLFRTPGMRPDLPEIKEALSHGAILTS